MCGEAPSATRVFSQEALCPLSDDADVHHVRSLVAWRRRRQSTGGGGRSTARKSRTALASRTLSAAVAAPPTTSRAKTSTPAGPSTRPRWSVAPAPIAAAALASKKPPCVVLGPPPCRAAAAGAAAVASADCWASALVRSISRCRLIAASISSRWCATLPSGLPFEAGFDDSAAARTAGRSDALRRDAASSTASPAGPSGHPGMRGTCLVLLLGEERSPPPPLDDGEDRARSRWCSALSSGLGGPSSAGTSLHETAPSIGGVPGAARAPEAAADGRRLATDDDDDDDDDMAGRPVRPRRGPPSEASSCSASSAPTGSSGGPPSGRPPG
mmetsp:Transcript_5754/g.23956  ORF Transcript_5754/g.23956 Transcript_5754/m.23956 type:complete len:328 (-) Transcript_5754:143-1126(-)